MVRIRLQRVICFILFIRAKKVLVLFVSIVSFTAADNGRRGFFGLLFVFRVVRSSVRMATALHYIR